ncbi:hypothetical protein [Streptomyces violascens]|uniref:DUF1911 domain-containing protein n=1 Tax=Streptomyces violascens TaxID=67381 RepID=A0ABQ3QRT5_9ACTN|nr:hypothetical protein [Streptomyces violascens]GHI39962.1 hypothetical protein Sviol_43700 [Streptomyces violascens]
MNEDDIRKKLLQYSAARKLDLSESDLATLSVMIDRDDRHMRHVVGECFKDQLCASPVVHDTFFSDAPAPKVPAHAAWIGDVAAALVAWSVSLTSHYGFGSTADASKAEAYAKTKLVPGNDELTTLGFTIYDTLFANHCGMDKLDFGIFLEADDHEQTGTLLANVLTDDAFVDKEMLGFLADPKDFYQRLQLLFYKIGRLNPGEKDRVVAFWKDLLSIDSFGSWTIYEQMQANWYSDQTFMAEVQTAIEMRTTKAWYEQASASGGVVLRDHHVKGDGVAAWLDAHHSYGFVTGNKPDNYHTVYGGYCGYSW